MSNITCLRHALPMSQDINKALTDLDSAIAKAINAAKAAGLLRATSYLSCTGTPSSRPAEW